MFSFLLDHDFFAPRPNPEKELRSLLKGGRFDDALRLLTNQEHRDIFNLDELDDSGLSVLHVASAAGALEIVVELLSKGADVDKISSTGCSALHYAASNNRKRIVEVLIRSGADSSLPNGSGYIAAELCSDPEVLDLLLRERPNQMGLSPRQLMIIEASSNDFLQIPTRNQPITETASAVELPNTLNSNGSNSDDTVSHLDQLISRISLADTANINSNPNIISSPSINPPPFNLFEGVLRAAIETTNTIKSKGSYEQYTKIFSLCQKTQTSEFERSKLRSMLRDHPQLATVRATGLLNTASDGWTPLHTAARWGNVEIIKILLQDGHGVSSWCVDLQGCTPIHVAVEYNQTEAVQILKRAMRDERQVDPVGAVAPGDLTGTTPLGWHTLGSNINRYKGKPDPLIREALFSPGDPSILPHTPHTNRSKSARSIVASGLGVSYGYSEAMGWSKAMEDRVLVRCPMPGLPSWSLFGVFDGHGGAYCSTFMAAEFPILLLQQVIDARIAEEWDDNNPFKQKSQLEKLLKKAILSADRKLQDDPHMKVVIEYVTDPKSVTEIGPSGRASSTDLPKVPRFIIQDTSGSTAVVCFLSATILAVANVGDSRAVLGRVKRPSDATDGNSIAASAGRSGLVAVPLSYDHKLGTPSERQRAEAAGGIVSAVSEDPRHGFEVRTDANPTRLRMSRSVGDFCFKQRPDLPQEKQIVTADPEVLIHSRSTSDAFVVLGSDGVYDFMTNQEIVDFMAQALGYSAEGEGPEGGCDEKTLASACDALLAESLRRGSQDNMSVVVIQLLPTVLSASSAGPVSSAVAETPSPLPYSPPATIHSGDPSMAAAIIPETPAADLETDSPMKAMRLFSV